MIVDGKEVEQLEEEATTPESDAGTQIPKFKSAEDRDKAYLELEKQSHATAQELSEMKRKLEDFQSSQQMRQEPEAPSHGDYSRSPDELKKFWARFAEKPQEVFGEWATKTMEQVEQRIAVRDAARDAINDFKAKHPDLAPYEEIVSVFVQRQPGNLNPREKLERAAPEARKMIASIAQRGGSAQQQGIEKETFVEAPSNSRESSPRTVKQPVQQEDALSEYLREVSAQQASKATPPRTRH